MSTNGTHPTASSADEAIDLLYAWYPPQTAPAACPEAVFSLTLKGHIAGNEALLTCRGQTPAQFKANLEAIRGLLDPVSTPPRSTPGETGKPTQGPASELHWCRAHQVQMTENVKDHRRWWSHRLLEGGFCKGK